MNNIPPRYDKLEFPVDPQPGSPDRQWAFIQTTNKGIPFQGTIQPQHGHGRYRIQGKTLKSVEIAMRAKLEWIYRHGKADVVKLSAQDEKDALVARRRMDELGFNLTLSVLIGAGVRYYEELAAVLPKDKDGGFVWKDTPDLIKLGAEVASRHYLTMGKALDKLVESRRPNWPKAHHQWPLGFDAPGRKARLRGRGLTWSGPCRRGGSRSL
jgi:hypothetical protein